MRGDIFFRTKLLGSSLSIALVWTRSTRTWEHVVPCNVGCVESAEPNGIFVVGHVGVCLEA